MFAKMSTLKHLHSQKDSNIFQLTHSLSIKSLPLAKLT